MFGGFSYFIHVSIFSEKIVDICDSFACLLVIC